MTAAQALWYYIWRGFVWVILINVVAYYLDLTFDWKLFVLCCASGFIDTFLYKVY